MRPFVVLALPRSRTAWLAKFLAPGQLRCGHDLAIECESVHDFVSYFVDGDQPLAGTIETGSVEGFAALRALMPAAQFIVIRKSEHEVILSLAKLGISGHEVEDQVCARGRMLDAVSAEPGVITIRHSALASEACCAYLFQLCTGLTHDSARWQRLAGINVQIDMAERHGLLRERAEAIAKLKHSAQAFGPMPKPAHSWTIAREPWAGIWPEIEPLGRQHFAECNAGLSPRPYAPNAQLMQLMSLAGLLHWWTARDADGRLVGYMSWSVLNDPESTGLVYADQGAWYIEDSGNSWGMAYELWHRALADLKLMSVRQLYLHHHLQGRGAHLGQFFERQGAAPMKTVYSLWLEDQAHG